MNSAENSFQGRDAVHGGTKQEFQLIMHSQP